MMGYGFRTTALGFAAAHCFGGGISLQASAFLC
jgi:hypothetical protein